MTEIIILTICFLITFGFIGYKLSNIVKKTLNEYKQKIENNIKESELIKQQAVCALDEAIKKKKFVNDEIEKNNEKFKKNIEIIKVEFNDKLENMKKNITKSSEKKIKYDKENSIELIKDQIKKIIKNVVNEYIEKELSKEEKENVIQDAISKIDFKKLSKKQQ